MKYIILLSLFALIRAQYDEEPTYQIRPLADAIDMASMKMLKESFKEARDKNVISSPLGALMLLSMYNAGTGGMSRRQIMRLFRYSDYEQLTDSFIRLTEKFSAMDPNYLVLASKVYVSDRYTLEENFANVTRAYKSEVEQIDFTQQEAAANKINKWASEKTKGHIPSAVSKDSIDEDTAVALYNAIFFQGQWQMQFERGGTQERDFYTHMSETVKKPMMQLEETLYYYENERMGAKMIALPYKETGFRMVVVLPDEVDGLPGVLENLSRRGLLQYFFSLRPTPMPITVGMPKFEIKNKIDLKNVLMKMGLSSIFVEGARGVVRERAVVVTEAFQEAFVKVDEEGATAGAFTGYGMRIVGGYRMEFKVDRPFMFAILHEDIVLFAGTYTH